MNIPNNPLPDSFDDWLNENSKYLPEEMHSLLEEQRDEGHLVFVFAWKRYEQLTAPLLFDLMAQQYPTVVAADESYEKHRQKVVEHRIFNTAEFAWEIIKHNAPGEQPKDVMPDIFDMAVNDMNSPEYSRTIYSKDNPPAHWIEAFGETEGWEMAEEWNNDQQRAIAFLNRTNSEIIAALQEHLLRQFPALLGMDAPWWKVYKFLLLSECSSWRDKLNQMGHMIEYKLSGDWLDKPWRELIEELDRLHEAEWQERYGEG